MELIGMCILPNVAISVVARKYGYWCDGDTSTRGKEDRGRKKRKRFMGMMLSNESLFIGVRNKSSHARESLKLLFFVVYLVRWHGSGLWLP